MELFVSKSRYDRVLCGCWKGIRLEFAAILLCCLLLSKSLTFALAGGSGGGGGGHFDHTTFRNHFNGEPGHRGASGPFLPTPDELFCVLLTYSRATGTATDLALARMMTETGRRRLQCTVRPYDRLLQEVRNSSLGVFKHEVLGFA